MTRDMDLVRTLLLKIGDDRRFNGRATYRLDADELATDGFSYEEIDYHLGLLIDAGLLEGQRMASPGFIIKKLSWSGHEFIDDTRDPDIWSKTKERAKVAGGLGLNLLWEIAKSEIKAKLGLS